MEFLSEMCSASLNLSVHVVKSFIYYCDYSYSHVKINGIIIIKVLKFL